MVTWTDGADTVADSNLRSPERQRAAATGGLADVVRPATTAVRPDSRPVAATAARSLAMVSAILFSGENLGILKCSPCRSYVGLAERKRCLTQAISGPGQLRDELPKAQREDELGSLLAGQADLRGRRVSALAPTV